MYDTNEETPEEQPRKKGPIFVRKTFGFGWTLNFERWESYVILGVLLVVIFYRLTRH